MSTQISQFQADAINNAHATMQAQQVGSLLKEILDLLASGVGAYPDKIKNQASAGSVDLTDADQGFVTASVSGVTFNLPSTAVDGITFKFIGNSAFTVVAPTGLVTTLPSTFKVQSLMQVHLIASNVEGVGLVWNVIEPRPVSAYDATTNYPPGMIVSSGGSYYISKTASNVGNTPASSPSAWFEL